jgi:hypothetical protein
VYVEPRAHSTPSLHAGFFRLDSPQGILLPACLIEGAHVPPEGLVQVLHVVQLLDHRAAEVDGEVCAVVVAARTPAALVALLLLLALLGRLSAQRVQVEEAVGGGRDGGARLRRLLVGRGGGGAEQRRERGKMGHAHAARMCRVASVAKKQREKAALRARHRDAGRGGFWLLVSPGHLWFADVLHAPHPGPQLPRPA